LQSFNAVGALWWPAGQLKPPCASLSTLRHYDTSFRLASRFSASNSVSCAPNAARNGDKEVNVNPDRILRLKSVLNRTGLSRSTLYRKIKEGTFPPQVKISINGTGWRESAINLWIEDPVAFHMRAHG
jgi:prophage regulatory protein